MARIWFVLTVVAAFAAPLSAAEKPNILWITSEDNGPHLGCYGDDYADTPNIDSIAEHGTIYLNAWSNAPVCAPARTTLITGMYPPSLGAQHMRSSVAIPDSIRLYPKILREAGYYCTNNVKTDYNVKSSPQEVWNESSRKAHWRNRPKGQPFFAIFNFTTSHESQVRKRPHTPVHDPAKVRVPAYHPDTPEVRRDWAQYYDKLTEMDRQVGGVLDQLRKDGLEDDTIIFYYGDHGAGMPRSKRWPYNSGLLVPLIVRIPEKFRSLASKDYADGGRSDRLVAFVDLAPTVISLAGVEPPANMQGKAFLGKYEAAPKEYLFGFRGRMDERYDMVRSVRDKRYVYLRQFMPHRRYGERVDYMFQTPTTQVWYRLFSEGKLNEAQSHFWQTKPSEELYDLQSDPDEVNNLAESSEHQEILQRFRNAQQKFLLASRDAGFLPEPMMHRRAGKTTIYEMAQDQSRYPIKTILAEAEAATREEPVTFARLQRQIEHDDAAVRFWAIEGAVVHGKGSVSPVESQLVKLMRTDPAPSVRIVAAEAVGRYGQAQHLAEALDVLVTLSNVETQGAYTAIFALNSLDALDDKAAGVRERIAKLPTKHPSLNRDVRMGGVLQNLVKHLTGPVQIP